MGSLSEQIATLVLRFLPSEAGGRRSIGPPVMERNNLGSLLHSIDVAHYPELIRNVWRNEDAGFIGVSASELNEIVARKAAKLPNYAARCDEVWLLIVADASTVAQTGILEDGVMGKLSSHGFQRVYFYDPWEEKPLRLV